MQVFLLKLSKLIGLVILCILASFLINKLYLKKANIFKLDDNITTVILGDSHTRYAVNDSLNDSWYNLSQDADSYLYSFMKLEQLIENNNKFDTLLLAFSHHNFRSSTQEKWLLNPTHMSSRMKKYGPILDLHSSYYLLKKRPSVILQSLFSQFKFPYYLRANKKILWYGNFGHMKTSEYILNLDSARLQNKIHYDNSALAKEEIYWLNEIIKLCENNNIYLALVSTPTYKLIQEDFNFLRAVHKENYKNIPFFDLRNININKPGFADLGHLSPIGANKFTPILVKALKG